MKVYGEIQGQVVLVCDNHTEQVNAINDLLNAGFAVQAGPRGLSVGVPLGEGHKLGDVTDISEMVDLLRLVLEKAEPVTWQEGDGILSDRTSDTT